MSDTKAHYGEKASCGEVGAGAVVWTVGDGLAGKGLAETGILSEARWIPGTCQQWPVAGV